VNIETCSVCAKVIVANSPHVTVVVPFYKSEDHVSHVLEFVQLLSEKIPGGVNAVFVIDGSPDRAEEFLRNSIDSKDYPIRVISLSRNFGVGPALHAAFSDETNLCLSVVFGSDLQEPNDLFVDFATSILSGECSVALGQRESRDDPIGMRVTSAIYWYMYRKLISPETPKGGYDVFGVSRDARSALVGLVEQNTNITAQIQWIGFDRKYFSFVRSARISGKSTWTFRKRFGLFVDTFLGFSDKFLLPIYYLAFTLLVLGGTSSFFVALGFELPKGIGNVWPPLALALQGLLLMAVAVVGSVVVRSFENSKNRPRYIIQRTFQNHLNSGSQES
jgi:glycosyltransferase involved in cell wall biosynthesis